MKNKETKIIKAKSNVPAVKQKEITSLALPPDKRIQTAEGWKKNQPKAK